MLDERMKPPVRTIMRPLHTRLPACHFQSMKSLDGGLEKSQNLQSSSPNSFHWKGDETGDCVSHSQMKDQVVDISSVSLKKKNLKTL